MIRLPARIPHWFPYYSHGFACWCWHKSDDPAFYGSPRNSIAPSILPSALYRLLRYGQYDTAAEALAELSRVRRWLLDRNLSPITGNSL